MRNLLDSKTRVVVEHKRINLHKRTLNCRKQISLIIFKLSFRSIFRRIAILTVYKQFF